MVGNVSINQTIKIIGGGSTSSGGSFSTSSTQYAIVTAGGANAIVTVGSATFTVNASNTSIANVYVPPSKSVTLSSSAGQSFSWVIFENN